MTKSSEQLNEFISRANAAGKSESEISSMLIAAGWDEGVVAGHFAASGDLVVPPPPAPKSSGREIFFYLLQFFTLGTVAISFGGVIFAVINRYFTDQVALLNYDVGSGIQSALAALIVAAPIFYLVTLKLVKDVATGRTSVRSGVRRVITYLALFLASATAIGDVIALVYRFLAGEVNARFLLKVVTILVIGGWIIFYYYLTVKRDEKGQEYPRQWHRTHGFAYVVIVLIAIISGFIVGGSPAERQKYVRDQQRVSELVGITWQVQSFYEKEQKLPETMEVMYQGYNTPLPSDPLTGDLYIYKPTAERDYQLCANFETDDKVTRQKYNERMAPIVSPYEYDWTHPASAYCFEREISVQPNK